MIHVDYLSDISFIDSLLSLGLFGEQETFIKAIVKEPKTLAKRKAATFMLFFEERPESLLNKSFIFRMLCW